MDEKTIAVIEERIGYVFKNKALLVRAFTHASAVSDHTKDYQVLEFLGDSVVDFVVADELIKKHKKATEGELTKIRAGMVSELPLAGAIDRIRIAEYLQLGSGEARANVQEHSSVKCDLFESVTGAVYLDGGMEKARKFVLYALEDNFAEESFTDDNSDAKSRLNEAAAKLGKSVEYVLSSQSGPSHKPSFTFEVKLDGEAAGKGSGTTKKDAQQAAAAVALERIVKPD